MVMDCSIVKRAVHYKKKSLKKTPEQVISALFLCVASFVGDVEDVGVFAKHVPPVCHSLKQE